MRVLRRSGMPAPFFGRLRAASRGLLMLDYDGTLAPFTADRDHARPYPGVVSLAAELIAERRTRIVIVSGRAAADVARLLGLPRWPEIWGSHGWEHLGADGGYVLAPLDTLSAERLDEARRALDRVGLGPRREDKPVGVAAHWRDLAAADANAMRAAVLAVWTPLVAGSALEIHAFDGGLELRAKGRDKGSAVDAVLAEEGEGAIAAYLGDDLTDEDAFRAIAGRGLGVLVRPEWRDTLADLWLSPPDELLQFLRDWRNATRSRSQSGS